MPLQTKRRSVVSRRIDSALDTSAHLEAVVPLKPHWERLQSRARAVGVGISRLERQLHLRDGR